MAWTMAMRASWMSYSSRMALTMGLRPLVVQNTHEMKFGFDAHDDDLRVVLDGV